MDGLFVVSHHMGTAPFCITLVTTAVVVALVRGKRREAALWLLLGISTYLLQKGLKLAIGRPRPDLWRGPVVLSSYAMPSGHALAAATFYPLLARGAAELWPQRAGRIWLLAIATAFFVGFGRLYLGVHWPSDVVVGWTIGAGQTWFGMRWADRPASTSGDSATAASGSDSSTPSASARAAGDETAPPSA